MVGLLGRKETPSGLSRLARHLAKLREPGAPARTPVHRQQRAHRHGWVLEAVVQVLTNREEPMRAKDIHTAMETLLGEPVASSSVKMALTSNAALAFRREVSTADGHWITDIASRLTWRQLVVLAIFADPLEQSLIQDVTGQKPAAGMLGDEVAELGVLGLLGSINRDGDTGRVGGTVAGLEGGIWNIRMGQWRLTTSGTLVAELTRLDDVAEADRNAVMRELLGRKSPYELGETSSAARSPVSFVGIGHSRLHSGHELCPLLSRATGTTSSASRRVWRLA
jgi:hypothetical protein